MQIGIAFANTAWYTDAAAAVRLAVDAEAAGVESLWTVEHVVVPVGYASPYPYDASGKMPGGREDFDIPDPFVWLAYVAAHTQRIRLGTGIVILPQRNPLVTAKEVATLDAMSGGRVLFGVGVGWLKEEFDALGEPFAERGRRLDEYIDVLRAAWGGAPAEFHGRFVDFAPLWSRPAPARGSVPIVIGGHSEAAAQRAGRLGDGFFPGGGSVEELTHLFGVVRTAAQEAGRDPAAVELTAGAIGRGDALHERIEALARLGVSRVIIGPPPPGDLSHAAALVERYRDL